LLHDYDAETDVEVISEHDDTDVNIVSEHADTEVQGGRDVNKNFGDEDDDDYDGTGGELGSLSDIEYDISKESVDLVSNSLNCLKCLIREIELLPNCSSTVSRRLHYGPRVSSIPAIVHSCSSRYVR
ncbi:hypothetical protein RYX36_010863, partial [Vicia faba]